jgi:hypothetical protein
VTRARPLPRGFHRCPCGCEANVPDRLFACRRGWARLPMDQQAAILATRELSLTDQGRAAIVGDAVEFYRTHPNTRKAP